VVANVVVVVANGVASGEEEEALEVTVEGQVLVGAEVA
jgi:hypothetical protein